jgi:hypothetical protein
VSTKVLVAAQATVRAIAGCAPLAASSARERDPVSGRQVEAWIG